MSWLTPRKIALALSPPLLTRAVRGVVGYTRWRRLLSRAPGERGPEWYDRAFELDDVWRRHYTESHSYPVWTVVADRLVGRGVTSVLELGCGSGQLAHLLHDKRIASYCGLDFSPRRIEHARRLCPEYTFHVEDVVAGTRQSEDGWDAVVAKAFLEHIEDDLAVVERVRSGALFIGSVPDLVAPSHVRHFVDEGAVEARYGRFFSELRIDRFPLASGRVTVFLFEGVRR